MFQINNDDAIICIWLCQARQCDLNYWLLNILVSLPPDYDQMADTGNDFKHYCSRLTVWLWFKSDVVNVSSFAYSSIKKSGKKDYKNASKTHLQQRKNSKFSGEVAWTPRFNGRGSALCYCVVQVVEASKNIKIILQHTYARCMSTC